MGTESWLGPVEPVFQTSCAHRRGTPSPHPRPPSCLALGPQPSWLLISQLPAQGCALSSIFCRTDQRDVCAPGLRGAVAQASADSLSASWLSTQGTRLLGPKDGRSRGISHSPCRILASLTSIPHTYLPHLLSACPVLGKHDIEAIKDPISPYKELSI